MVQFMVCWYSRGDIWWYPLRPPSTVRDWYQNVPQDMNFHIFDVNKQITLAKFWFLTNYVQSHDEKISISGMGWGRLTLHKNLHI